MKTETIYNLYEYDCDDMKIAEEIAHIEIIDKGDRVDWTLYMRDKATSNNEADIDKLAQLFKKAAEIVLKLEKGEQVKL